MGGDEQKSRLRLAACIFALLQIVAGVVAAFTLSAPKAVAGPEPQPAPVAVAAPAPAPIAVPGETDAADAIGATVPLFEAPNAPKPFNTLTNPTWEGVPLILHVLEARPLWLNVRVNTRPNGATAWIRRSDVKIRRVPNRIVIELGPRQLTVLHGNDVLAKHTVAIGSPSAPTPLGDFYVDATVRIPKPTGPYGAGQLSVSGFSNVHKTFGGGIGQIAIHGTNNPRAIGGSVSAGCVRMLNEAWIQVAALAPNGTPVSIRA